MRIRSVRHEDLATLGLPDFGHDFLMGKVAVDDQDKPVMFAGAWSRAEVHMKVGEWGSPAARWLLLQHLHREMEKDLARKGVGEVLTWFDKTENFCRRLTMLGWGKSPKIAFCRKINS